jgi:uncharacterized protein (TIGR01777 family)
MRVIVTGANGLIGHALARALSTRGDDVVGLCRHVRSGPAQLLGRLPGVTVREWDPGSDGGDWVRDVDGASAVVNLAGESIADHRWSPEYKRRILDSRVRATRTMVRAIRSSANPPLTLVNASAVGYYGDRGDEVLTEAAAPGADFLASVCREWEHAATEQTSPGLKVVLARIGIVFAAEGGALPRMALPFRLFGGGPIGDGRQWVSWIHLRDVVGLLLLALDSPLSGPMNVTAPEPVRSHELSRLVGESLRRPSWLPVPRFGLRLALGEMADAVLGSQRVKPDAALRAGYRWVFQTCREALDDALHRGS